MKSSAAHPTEFTAPLLSLVFGPFVLDRQGARLLRDGKPVEIAPKTLGLLEYLAQRPGEMVSKDDMLDAVWGHRFVSDSVLKVAINGLRAALGEDAREPRWVHTVPRRGYRFASDVQVLGPTGQTLPAGSLAALLAAQHTDARRGCGPRFKTTAWSRSRAQAALARRAWRWPARGTRHLRTACGCCGWTP
jgi:DNA-binding winged helix-turn-helix (wHTH) protein